MFNSVNADVIPLELKPEVGGEQNQSLEHPLAKGHKYLIATATLASYDEHTTAPPAKAVVLFTSYVQDGVSKPVNTPCIKGSNITAITWNFNVKSCWARAVITILTFD